MTKMNCVFLKIGHEGRRMKKARKILTVLVCCFFSKTMYKFQTETIFVVTNKDPEINNK